MLNPIEQVFAKLETLLRKAAKRTTEDITRQIERGDMAVNTWARDGEGWPGSDLGPRARSR
jgi:hypothetical protein